MLVNPKRCSRLIKNRYVLIFLLEILNAVCFMRARPKLLSYLVVNLAFSLLGNALHHPPY